MRAKVSGSRSCGEFFFTFFFGFRVFSQREREKTQPLPLPALLLPPSKKYRYNIGGSGWDCPGKSDMRPGGAVPSFLKPDGKSYDWSVDAGQRWTLLAAKERGASVFEAFSNSPPCFMTKSGYASGNWDANDDNLPSKNYEVRKEKEGFFFFFEVFCGGKRKQSSLNFFSFFSSLSKQNRPSPPTWPRWSPSTKKSTMSLSGKIVFLIFWTFFSLPSKESGRRRGTKTKNVDKTKPSPLSLARSLSSLSLRKTIKDARRLQRADDQLLVRRKRPGRMPL